jgi:hypothetical protein
MFANSFASDFLGRGMGLKALDLRARLGLEHGNFIGIGHISHP